MSKDSHRLRGALSVSLRTEQQINLMPKVAENGASLRMVAWRHQARTQRSRRRRSHSMRMSAS
jgi:hypothetical protein